MTQAHKAQKQPQDLYAQQGKVLASLVQRLRGWVGSDPSRVPELTDALIQLTAHRLLGHGYAAAGEDAQDAVRRAAELLAAKGPIGPYTSVSDAARYVTAVCTGSLVLDKATIALYVCTQLSELLFAHLPPLPAVSAPEGSSVASHPYGSQLPPIPDPLP